MQFSSLHTHSVFCDGKDDIETLCAVAYQKRLVSIGFSSHAPINRAGFDTDWHLLPERFDEYLDEIRAARGRWDGRLKVFAGLEVDYIKGLIGPNDFKSLNLDYAIGSVHYLVPPKGEPFTVDGPIEEFEKGLNEGFSGNIDDLVNAYWDAEEDMVKEGGFDILGHADLIKKNNDGERFFRMRDYSGRLSQLADLITDATVEVNTGGINRGKTSEVYPSPLFLRLLKERNVPLIITADAHKAEQLDGHYADAVKAMREAGYTETVFFEGRLDGISQWNLVKI